jgi:hypothetical protein
MQLTSLNQQLNVTQFKLYYWNRGLLSYSKYYSVNDIVCFSFFVSLKTNLNLEESETEFESLRLQNTVCNYETSFSTCRRR